MTTDFNGVELLFGQGMVQGLGNSSHRKPQVSGAPNSFKTKKWPMFYDVYNGFKYKH